MPVAAARERADNRVLPSVSLVCRTRQLITSATYRPRRCVADHAGKVVKTLQMKIALVPAAITEGHPRHADSPGYSGVGLTSAAGQQDLDPLNVRIEEESEMGKALKLLNLIIAED